MTYEFKKATKRECSNARRVLRRAQRNLCAGDAGGYQARIESGIGVIPYVLQKSAASDILGAHDKGKLEHLLLLLLLLFLSLCRRTDVLNSPIYRSDVVGIALLALGHGRKVSGFYEIDYG